MKKSQKSKSLTWTYKKTSHTTWTFNIKIQVICLYNSYYKYEVHVVWLVFFSQVRIKRSDLRDFSTSFMSWVESNLFLFRCFGPDSKVRPLRSKLLCNADDWDQEDPIIHNLGKGHYIPWVYYIYIYIYMYINWIKLYLSQFFSPRKKYFQQKS